MTKVVIIGSGNVAEAFARTLPECGVEVVQVVARNAVRGGYLAETAGCQWTAGPGVAEADIYITAVSDRAIGEVLESLDIPDGGVVVHVSGASPLSVIPLRFARRGVLYPLQTFTAGRRVDFGETPFFVEGSDPSTTAFIADFARKLSGRVCEMDSSRRAELHLTGVFACNFVNAMYAAGGEMARAAGVDFEVLKPLIVETARKAVECRDPREVQTGPAVRGDRVTLERHLQLLARSGRHDLAGIYETISDYIKNGKKL